MDYYDLLRRVCLVDLGDAQDRPKARDEAPAPLDLRRLTAPVPQGLRLEGTWAREEPLGA